MARPDEVVIDVATASKKNLEVGEEISMQAQGTVQRLRISGFVKFGSSTRSAGQRSPASTSRPHRGSSTRSESSIRSASPPSRASPRRSSWRTSETVLPAGTPVRTGEEQAAEDAEDTNEFISFLRYFLLAFGVIALFVGAFVIVNSLSITIAQRTRELATLRTLGASQRQVRLLVVVKALVMGIVASVVGLFLGLALATGLFKLFEAVGFTLPNSGLVFTLRTVIVALGLGILVTLSQASFRRCGPPVFRPSRVREGSTVPPGRFARLRIPSPWS